MSKEKKDRLFHILCSIQVDDFIKFERKDGEIDIDYIYQVGDIKDGELTYNNDHLISLSDDEINYNKSISIYRLSNKGHYILTYKLVGAEDE